MKQLIKLEEFGMFLFSIYLFSLLDFSWWVYPALLLLPDISMFGYLFNPKIGAVTYNIGHHKGLAAVIFILGAWSAMPELELAGIILFGHASMDRMFGYGLKFSDDFKHTHLGTIGKTEV